MKKEIGDFRENELEFKRKEINDKGFLFTLIKDIKSIRNSFQKVADIGGGSGGNLILLKENNIDFKKGFVLDPFFRKNYIKELKKINVTPIKQNGEKLPFKNESLDLILLIEVLEHFLDPDQAIEEVKRCLKKDGILVLSTPNLATIWNRIALLLGYQPMFTEVSTKKVFGRPGSSIVGHLRVFTLSSLIEFIEFNGFEIVKIEALPFFQNPLLNLIERTFSKINKRFGSKIIILCKKKNEK